MLSVGDSLAGYEIVAPVKSGGMGALFVARRRGVGGFAKDVAIKVIHPHLATDEDFVKMFLDEARLTAGIDHPNVIHVHDAGFEDGYYYMVMELVTGCSLADVLKACADAGVRLAPRIGVAIARQVAAGLHAAHELRGKDGVSLGLVHRDVTPDNVMLGAHGTVKLIDFGIAKAAERIHLTRQPTLKGKLRYVAPEQLSGKSDRRTDLFALGAVLWESLTGLGLNDGVPETELLVRARKPVFPPPSEMARDVTPELDAAVASLLAADPTDRPATAAAAQVLLARAVPTALTVDPSDIARLVDATLSGSAASATTLVVAIPRIGGPAIFTAPPVAPPPPAKRRIPRWVLPVAIVGGATLITVALLMMGESSGPTNHTTTATESTPVQAAPAIPSTPLTPMGDVGITETSPPNPAQPLVGVPVVAPAIVPPPLPPHRRAHPVVAPTRAPHAHGTSVVDGVPLSEGL